MLSPDVIKSARADYAAGMRVVAICKKHGISRDALYYWIDGGPAQGDQHLQPMPRRRRGVARPGFRPTRGRGAIVRRLWRAASAQVREIEHRLTQHTQAPDERDRDARALAVLVRTLRELAALDETKTSQAASRKAVDDDDIPRDMDEFRRELARRMDAFVERRTGARIPD